MICSRALSGHRVTTRIAPTPSGGGSPACSSLVEPGAQVDIPIWSARTDQVVVRGAAARVWALMTVILIDLGCSIGALCDRRSRSQPPRHAPHRDGRLDGDQFGAYVADGVGAVAACCSAAASVLA